MQDVKDISRPSLKECNLLNFEICFPRTCVRFVFLSVIFFLFLFNSLIFLFVCVCVFCQLSHNEAKLTSETVTQKNFIQSAFLGELPK